MPIDTAIRKAALDLPGDLRARERTFRHVKLSECVERGPRWLIQGLIEQGAVTAVTGEPGSGKTFLLVDLALHVASGRSWFGRKVEKGVVIYIAAEAAESTQRRAALVRRVKFSQRRSSDADHHGTRPVGRRHPLCQRPRGA